MPDERDQLAQAQAEQASEQQTIQGLELRMAAQESAHATEIEQLRALIKAVEQFAQFQKPIGKDGVKVEWPFIGLDAGVGAQSNGNGPGSPLNQYPVLLIENGVSRILTPYTLEEPPEPEVD